MTIGRTDNMQNLLYRFNSKVNLEEIRKELAANSNGTNREQVPSGIYEVKVEKMELRPTKKEDPMLSIWFRILDGKYKNQCVFFNRVLTTGKNISFATSLLKSFKTDTVVEFEDFVQFNDVIGQVFEAINRKKYEFALKLTKQDNGFDDYEIADVFQA